MSQKPTPPLRQKALDFSQQQTKSSQTQ